MTKCIELGSFEAVRNGVPLRYKIQTITPELLEDCLDLMVQYFIPREPISIYLRLMEDPDAVNCMKEMWRKTMNTGQAIVALEETKDNTVNIVGANMTLVVEKELKEKDKDPPKEYKNENFEKLLGSVIELTNRANIFEKYDIDKYLTAYGLAVHSNYHGYQIGYRLLQCRQPLCEALGVKATGTVFTAKVSQHIASKAGFELLAEQIYKSYLYKGEYIYQNLEGDMKFMAVKYN
ncbi:hypothetical protein O3M35_001052 [Rhynocoris fuscipes]